MTREKTTGGGGKEISKGAFSAQPKTSRDTKEESALKIAQPMTPEMEQ